MGTQVPLIHVVSSLQVVDYPINKLAALVVAYIFYRSFIVNPVDFNFPLVQKPPLILPVLDYWAYLV